MKEDEKEVLTAKRYTDPMIAAQVLLAQRPLGAIGASGAAQVNPILAGGGSIEDIINPRRAKLRAIAKQQKYNGNPHRWDVLERECSWRLGKNELRDNDKLDALLGCLGAAFMTLGLNPSPIGLNPLTHSLTASCSLRLRDEEVGCQKTTTEPSSLHSRLFRSSFSRMFRTSGNALRIW